MAKKICFLMISLLMCFALTVMSASAANTSLGDVSGDGEITASDARLVLRASAGLQDLTAEQYNCGDINGDTEITASDARIILRISAGLDSIDNYVKEEPQEPETTTKAPETITQAPETTTKAPETTTQAPETTTKAPETTTQAPEETTIDLSVFLGKYLDDIKAVIGDLVLESVGFYSNDVISVCTYYRDDIYIIGLMGESDYSVFGVQIGQSASEAESVLKAKGFTEEEDGVWYEEDTEILCEYNVENGKIVYVACGKMTGPALDPGYNDIQYLLYESKSYIMDTIPGLKYNSYQNAYTSPDNVSVTFDRNNEVTIIRILDESEYTLLGLAVGMDMDEVLYYSTTGAYEDEDKSYFCSYDYSEGIKVIAYYNSDGIVTELCALKESHDLEDYLGWHIDEVLEVFPYLSEYSENIYMCGSFVFAFDENGIITEAGIRHYSRSQAYGCYYGQQYRDAVNVIKEQGFEYYTTNSGMEFYVNYQTEELMYIMISEGMVYWASAMLYR